MKIFTLELTRIIKELNLEKSMGIVDRGKRSSVDINPISYSDLVTRLRTSIYSHKYAGTERGVEVFLKNKVLKKYPVLVDLYMLFEIKKLSCNKIFIGINAVKVKKGEEIRDFLDIQDAYNYLNETKSVDILIKSQEQ